MNNNRSLIVDINTISSTKKQITTSYTELIDLINQYKEKIIDTENVFNTESGIMYRDIAVVYIELIKKYMNKEFMEYINNLDSIENLYTDLYNSIISSVEGENI